MFGFSFGKILVFVIVIALIWYGFKYMGRLQRLEKGERRPTERNMGERIRKSFYEKTGKMEEDVIEETEKCVKCHVYVPLGAGKRCNRSDCPY